ncbi:MAG: PQQ-binding-like beta-propeller repeat protein [Planctomycetales bacterium]|nr:PQQ-binding-like beta-propeller repeat protein [Planctomycetales bacterium]
MRPNSSHFTAATVLPNARGRGLPGKSRTGVSTQAFLLWAAFCLAVSPDAWLYAGDHTSVEEQESIETQHSLYYGVYLPSQRPVARALAVANDMLADERYAEALPIILRVLNAAEDSFGGQNAQLQSLKRQAREVILNLPPAGYQAYLLEVEAESKRDFQQAIQSGSGQLAEVAARFPRTNAGRAASWLLTQRALDFGNPAEAAAQMRELLRDPDLTAADREALGQQLSWAQQFTPAQIQPLDGRGNLVSDKPAPHFWAKWVCEYAADPSWGFQATEELLSSAPPPGAGFPLVVGRWVLVRGRDGLYAIERDTGKLGWQAALATPGIPAESYSNRREFRAARGVAQDLIRRQLDAVNSRISSNGSLVFALIPAERPQDNSRNQLWMLRGRRDAGRWDTQTNEVVAIDIPSEGKFAWRTGRDPALKKVFFLDAPLSVSGRLYTLGEFEQTIFLFQLDPATGRLLWKQANATVESPVAEESLRMTCGGALSAAHGLILCSTGVGLLVAVDPGQRSLKWVYRVPAEAAQETAKTSPWGRGRAYRESQDDSKRWLQNRILVNGDRAYLATPESQRLCCVNLQDGREEWSVRHGYPQLLCCANNEALVMAAEDQLLCLSPTSGESKWRLNWPPLTAPSGCGALFGDHYLQPLSDGTVMMLDWRDGALVERLVAAPEGLVGNMAIDGDNVYSQSFSQVARFEVRLEPVGGAAFAAQVAATHGRRLEASRLWRQAYQEQGGIAAQEPLRESLLASLLPQEPDEDQLSLLSKLSQDRESPNVIQIARLQKAVEQRDTAFVESTIRKARQSAPGERLLVMSPQFAMSPTQWRRSAAEQALTPGQIDALRATLLDGAGPARRRAIAETLGARAPLSTSPSVSMAPAPSHWGAHQVQAELQPREQLKSGNGNNATGDPVEIELTLNTDAGATPYGGMTLFVNSERMLIGRNRYGETVLLVELPNGLFDQLEKLLESQEVVAFVRGDRFFLPTGPDVISFRIVNGVPTGVWQAMQTIRRSRLDPVSPSGPMLRREIANGLSGDVQLLTVNSQGVVITARNLLTCLDPRTGAVRWVRVGLKTNAHCSAGEQYAYSAPAARPAWRVRLSTGQLETIDASAPDVLATCGPMSAVSESTSTAKRLVVRNRLTQRDAFARELTPGFKHGLAGDLLTIVEDSGEALVVDVRQGELLFRRHLNTNGPIQSITTQQCGNRLVLVVNLTNRSDHDRRGVRSLDRNPICSGPVYCLDLTTGEQLWESPAVVSEMSLLSRRPIDCPVLVFAANARTEEGGNRRTELRVLVLDAATGRKLYQGTGPKKGRARQYRVRFDAGPEPHCYVTFDNCRLRLTSLDAPAAPAPPFVAAVEATPEKGFWQMRADLGRWLQEAPTEKTPEGAAPRHSDDD